MFSSRRKADELLASLVARHWGRSADLTARLAESGFSATQVPDWDTVQRVAIRPKSTLATTQNTGEHLGGFVASNAAPGAWFCSPGGIVEPLITRAVERLADLLRDAGFSADDRVLNGFSYHFTPAGLLFHEALRRIGAAVLPIGPQQTSLAAEFGALAGATAFVGIASHLTLLLQEIDRLPQSVRRPRLRLALAGAEPFGDEARRRIERDWGTVCLDMYGTAESGIVALECGYHRGLHLHADVLWEVLDPVNGTRVEAGQTGELVLTTDAEELALLRFGTGDLVRVDPTPCPCGRQSARLFVHGRLGDSARVRGMLLHASQLRAFAERAGDVLACRAVLRRLDGRDTIDVTWRKQEGGASTPEQLHAAFRTACRLRADSFNEDAALPKGTFELVDERQRSGVAKVDELTP
jgi:phenylacetate-coenzyme A ligase PaaK-like adenylate-forming protein